MLKKCFLFPGLPKYASGFSLPMNPELRRYDDIHFELTHFRDGKREATIRLTMPASPYLRSWQPDWGFRGGDNPTDLYCLQIISPSHPDVSMPSTDIESQILLRHPSGAVSSILTGFVPLRPLGHHFAPIIHTSHCMADAAKVETLNLFLNIKNTEEESASNGGTLTAYIYDRKGLSLGKANYPVLANATVAISHDQIARDCNIAPDILRQGISVKFYGGASQFAILMVFRHRLNNTIALEHSLAPHYYVPALKSPSVRELVYGQLEAS